VRKNWPIHLTAQPLITGNLLGGGWTFMMTKSAEKLIRVALSSPSFKLPGLVVTGTQTQAELRSSGTEPHQAAPLSLTRNARQEQRLRLAFVAALV